MTERIYKSQVLSAARELDQSLPQPVGMFAYLIKPDQGAVKGNVAHATTAEDLLMQHLGFCGCGDPDSFLLYFYTCLRAWQVLWTKIRSTPNNVPNPRFHEYWKEFEAHWPGQGQAYFVYYEFDRLGFTEHGGSVPGWLTDKGEDWVDAIREALEDEGYVFNEDGSLVEIV